MTSLRSRPSTSHSHRPDRILRSETERPPRSSSRPLADRFHVDKKEVPWQHMAHTYTWVVEQEFITLEKRDRKTEQWILEQQIFIAADGCERRSARGPSARRKVWEEVIYSYEIEAERWMRHEEEARRVAAEREKQKARIVQDELRRIETKIRCKREAEKQRFSEERARIYEEMREREKRNRLKADRATLDAWRDYEERWGSLLTSSDALEFSSIPWPVVSQPTKLDDMLPAAIVAFLLSQLHSQSQTRKDRIRAAQLRWHPDRFQRVLARVKEEDKAQVEEGVGIVARCLNDMMAQEPAISRQSSTMHAL